MAAVLLVIFEHRRTKKTMDMLTQMIDTAMDGTFTEDVFDESRMSALATKFAHFLSASTISVRNIALEKDKIKTLIADISHQTKTPIANLLLYSELLKEENLSDSAKNNVEAIHTQAEKLRFLIDALVKLSRLENGIITLSPRTECVFPMLEKIQKQFALKAEQKGLFLQVNPTEIFAKFDPKWTVEALGNIVDNAIKYTTNGGITISVIAYEMYVRIDVSDSGIGISEEERAKIFSRFYRSERVKEQPGVGIGLYLAREIISGEGGYIKVSSNQGGGTVFSVFLPK